MTPAEALLSDILEPNRAVEERWAARDRPEEGLGPESRDVLGRRQDLQLDAAGPHWTVSASAAAKRPCKLRTARSTSSPATRLW